MDVKRIGEWEVKIGTPKEADSKVVRELENFLTQEWRKAVLENIEQGWWSVQHLGVPSPIIRADIAPIFSPRDIKSALYEVEVRPAGLGIMLSSAPEKASQWREILLSFGCKGLINIESSIKDDKLAAEILEIPYYEEFPRELEGPYWIRTDQRIGKVASFEGISLGPIRLDGDKTYLVKLGMAEMLIVEELDWSEPFVVKPLVGSRMEGVEIYLPNSLKRKMGSGSSTKSRTIRIVGEGVPYILQKFIPPQRAEIEGAQGWIIWRLFFGWQERYRFIGGLWNWRPTLKVHGASDSVFGLIKES